MPPFLLSNLCHGRCDPIAKVAPPYQVGLLLYLCLGETIHISGARHDSKPAAPKTRTTSFKIPSAQTPPSNPTQLTWQSDLIKGHP